MKQQVEMTNAIFVDWSKVEKRSKIEVNNLDKNKESMKMVKLLKNTINPSKGSN